MKIEEIPIPNEEKREEVSAPEINHDWVEKCAFFLSKKREESGLDGDSNADWDLAMEIAKANPERSSQAEWLGGEEGVDEDIVQKEFVHQIYLKNYKPKNS